VTFIETINMKIKHCVLPIMLLCCIAPVVTAQSTAGLDLGGAIMPAACTPTISGGGVFDYGTINKANLNVGIATPFPDRPFTATISCSSPTRHAIRLIDNRNDSYAGVFGAPNSHAEFGLGKANEGQPIGGWMILFTSGTSTLDGGPLFMTTTQNNGGTWTASHAAAKAPFPRFDARPTTMIGFRSASGSAAGPALATDAVVSFDARVVIKGSASFNWATDLTLDGSVVFEVVYL
jgi:hypothetical protein